MSGSGIFISLSTVFEPLCGVDKVVIDAILSEYPRLDAAYLASSPPFEWAMMFTLSTSSVLSTLSMLSATLREFDSIEPLLS